jgi:hypothetical protein
LEYGASAVFPCGVIPATDPQGRAPAFGPVPSDGWRVIRARSKVTTLEPRGRRSVRERGRSDRTLALTAWEDGGRAVLQVEAVRRRLGNVLLMAFLCQRPDGNLLFPHPLRQGRVAAGHQQSQANGPASAGWWNRARRERLTPAKCPPCAAGCVDLASPRSTTCIEFDPRVCWAGGELVADATRRARVALPWLSTVTPSGVDPVA